MRITAPAPDHDQIGGVGTDDHHAIQHAIDSGLVHTGVITNAQHGVRSTANAHSHTNISGQGIDDHHSRDHILAGPVNHVGEISDTQHGVRAIANGHAHSAMSGRTVNDHHNEDHASQHLSGGGDVISNLARVATGTYTGDGTTSQAITGVGFRPIYVKIWRRFTSQTLYGNEEIAETTDTIVDDNASGMSVDWFPGTDDIIATVNSIIALGADGFTVDDISGPNANGIVFSFVAIG